MTDDMRARVTAALLKALYRQGLIPEDTYHHCLESVERDDTDGGGACT